MLDQAYVSGVLISSLGCHHAQLVIIKVYLGRWLTFWAVSAGMLQHTQSDREVVALMDVHGSLNYNRAFCLSFENHNLVIGLMLFQAATAVVIGVLLPSARSWAVAEVGKAAYTYGGLTVLCMVWCWFLYLRPAFNRQKMVREMSFLIALLQLLWIKFPEVRHPDSQIASHTTGVN